MITSFNNQQVHYIDGIPTIINSLKGNLAKGYIIRQDLTLEPCFVARVGDSFAHAATSRGAVRDAEAKHLEDSPLEERIERFIEAFPTLDTAVQNTELFTWHGTLTGSCRMGREQFVQDHDLDLDSQTTVRDFIELTRNVYGSKNIEALEKAYKETGDK